MIVVTGGAGFIGSAFVWKLNSKGIDDIIIVDELGTSDKWKNLAGKKFVDYIHKNDFINNLDNGNDYYNVEAIIHMGACSSTTERDGDYLMRNNYRYTRTLAEWSLMNNSRFIYASSAATYGDGSNLFSDNDEITKSLKPLNMYGYSKHIFDLWALRSGILDRITGLKFFNVFGPNEYHKGDMISMVFRAFHQIMETGSVKLFKSCNKEYKDGGQMRDFVYVKDCVNIMWWLLRNPQVNGIYNIGTGKARTWNDLVRAIFSAMKRKESIVYFDMPDYMKNRYQYYTEADMEKLKSTGCPVQFMSLEDSVADYAVNYLAKDNKCL